MTKLEKAQAMVCFGGLAGQVESDPDPKASDKLQDEYNCKICDSYKYCCELADTLKQSTTEESTRTKAGIFPALVVKE